MDAIVNQLARELADAIAAAVADDPRVEACRANARAAGFDLRVSLEATVGFANRDDAQPLQPVAGARKAIPRTQFEMTTGDRRFLKSLRIAADEPAEREVE